MVLFSIACPILGEVSETKQDTLDEVVITYNDQAITVQLPPQILLMLQRNVSAQETLKQNAKTKSDDIAIHLYDIAIQGYIDYAKLANDEYQRVAGFHYPDLLVQRYILERIIAKDSSGLNTAIAKVQPNMSINDCDYYADDTDIELMHHLDALKDKITMIHKVFSGDYIAYYRFSIKELLAQVQSREALVESLEKSIIENPSSEASYANQIDEENRMIKLLKETEIPLIEYRINHNIIPYHDWRHWALSSKSISPKLN